MSTITHPVVKAVQWLKHHVDSWAPSPRGERLMRQDTRRFIASGPMPMR